jgi:hypothetical protein
VGERKSFLLRMDPQVLDAMQRWANDDLRSLNAQIEFALRRMLEREGRSLAEVASANPASSVDPAPADTP